MRTSVCFVMGQILFQDVLFALKANVAVNLLHIIFGCVATWSSHECRNYSNKCLVACFFLYFKMRRLFQNSGRNCSTYSRASLIQRRPLFDQLRCTSSILHYIIRVDEGKRSLRPRSHENGIVSPRSVLFRKVERWWVALRWDRIKLIPFQEMKWLKTW